MGIDVARITADIVSAHLITTPMASEALPDFIIKIHQVVQSLDGMDATSSRPLPAEATAEGAVDPDRWPGVFRDYIICLEDGSRAKLLRTHLAKRFQMDLSAYKAKWGLPADYPAVPPAYRERKRQIAERTGLGTKVRSRKARNDAVEAPDRQN